MIDALQEMAEVLARNPLRTLLTAMGVFWGVLMLVLLLGFGEGLEQVATKSFAGSAPNAVMLWGGRTTLPFKGQRPGRWVTFQNDDVAPLGEMDGVASVAGRLQLGGWRNGNLVTRGSKTGSFHVMGDMPEIFPINGTVLEQGRFLDALDLTEQRKVAVVGAQVVKELFGGSPPLGEVVFVRGVAFTVVGVSRSPRADERGDRDNATIHVPLSTFQKAFNGGERLGWLAIMANEGVGAQDIEDRARQLLAERHQVHPEDENAFGAWNAQETVERVATLFYGIRLFIWIVGAATLMSGVVGVSNILLVVIRERTKEIGLRRALGATVASIVLMVVTEALVLTLFSGMAGLAAGIVVVEGTTFLLGPDHEVVGTPRVDPVLAFVAIGVLALAGLLAGLLPAGRAASIHPVEALRTE